MSFRSDVSKEWAYQARTATTSPLYQHLATEISKDPDVGSILEAAPVTQRLGVLLLAAVHYLLMTGVPHELATHYESLGGDNDADPYPAFRDFCLSHRGELEHLCATRSVQTNEVRRSGYLMPAIARIGHPVHLLECGASAGLNLIFDRYFFDYGAHGTTGDRGSAVHIAPEVHGEFTAPSMPAILDRSGLDPNPLDVRDDDTVMWLRACIWPEQHERRALLDAAVAVARADPPRIHGGFAHKDLVATARSLPDGPLCIVHSVMLPYLTPEQREQFREQLALVGAERELTIVSGEGAQGLSDVFGLELQPGEGFWVTITRDGRTEVLGRAGWHGEWIEWTA